MGLAESEARSTAFRQETIGLSQLSSLMRLPAAKGRSQAPVGKLLANCVVSAVAGVQRV